MDFPDYSPLFIAVFVFKWAVFVWDNYLNFRQRTVLKCAKTVPLPLNHVLDDQTMNKARTYSLDKMNFGFFHSLYGEIESSIILLLFVMPWVWNQCGDILEMMSIGEVNEIIQSLVFVLVFSIYSLITGKFKICGIGSKIMCPYSQTYHGLFIRLSYWKRVTTSINRPRHFSSRTQ